MIKKNAYRIFRVDGRDEQEYPERVEGKTGAYTAVQGRWTANEGNAFLYFDKEQACRFLADTLQNVPNKHLGWYAYGIEVLESPLEFKVVPVEEALK